MRITRYSGRIMEVAGCDHREALILENAMRWEVGGANPGTLDHFSGAEFDALVRSTAAAFAEAPKERAAAEREAELEGLVPARCA
jgi:hypothetical protein